MTDEQLEARLAKLEARVQALEDEREIRELLSRYGYNADCHRDEEYLDLYTDDGAIDLSDRGLGEGDVTRFQGKEALRKFITDPRGHKRPDLYGKMMHCQGNNVVVHIDGDEAIANSYSVVLSGDGPGASILTAGSNRWLLQKVDGRWLFKERRRRALGNSGFVENLDATPD